MGFFDQYRDRGPTVGEVFDVASRLRDAMLYDHRRGAAPDHTVFAAAWHVEMLRATLLAADSTCAVLDLAGSGVRDLAASVVNGWVFALDGETGAPVGINSEHVPDLVSAVGTGEAPVSAVARLGREYAERERLVHDDPALAEQIREGIAEAGRGETADLGGFAQHLDEGGDDD